MFKRLALRPIAERLERLQARRSDSFHADLRKALGQDTPKDVTNARLFTEVELRELGRQAAKEAGFDSAADYLAKIYRRQEAEFASPTDAPEYLANELFHAPTTERPPSPNRNMRTLSDPDTSADPDLSGGNDSDPDLSLD